MGRRDKTLKSAISHCNEQEDESDHSQSPTNPSTVHVITDDDDDEANEDLSLKIVEKSLLQACNSSDAVVPAPEDVDDVAEKSRKKVKKVKNKVKKKLEEIHQVEVVDEKDEENTDIIRAVESAEKVPIEKSDSLVLRKLLRGPRYFDPPDNGSGWGECYTCGVEGHTSANCTSAKRRKPCFICGSLEHQAKQCIKGKDCYICKKGGHHAKDCPEKYQGAAKNLKICLKCGDSGHHDIFSCNNEYSSEDLKGIQCYICKSFGHLCCADFADTSPIELSCYRCGQLGHGGMDCGRSLTEKTNAGMLGKCYKCQEVGHIAKKCSSSTKDCSQPRSEKANIRSPGKCHGCGEEGHIARDCPGSFKDYDESRCKTCFTCGKEGHIARECLRLNEVEKRKFELSTPVQKFSKESAKFKKAKSAASELLKARKRKKAEFEDRTPTPYSIKKRGGWITEDPMDLSSREAQVHQWDSPVTATYNRNMVYTSGINGHDFRFDDTRYGSTISYRRGPLDQRRDRYGHGPSSEPHRQYRHSPSNESCHQYGHAPSNGLHRQFEVVSSSRTHHRYVVSPPDVPHLAHADSPPTGPSPKRVVRSHHPYAPSPSHEAARAHHPPYLSSGSSYFFQQRYPSTSFHNLSGDGIQRIHNQNR